ncbi:hypothetical protein LuPra_02666 [Luteitalea pratensis]|uniref:Uncharacterized protein n=1 Tax=Luteitalea pratensis TaxID=1855912 RepID=A0A143PNU6_LUTPR|nr:hypothetical protein LuPra_02666 [Luteitalea pratensis]
MPLRGSLRFLQLSPSRFHAWRRRQRACVLDDQASCPRSSPQRLTRRDRGDGDLGGLPSRADADACGPRAATRHRLRLALDVVSARAEARMATPAAARASEEAEDGCADDTPRRDVAHRRHGDPSPRRHPRLRARRHRQLLATDFWRGMWPVRSPQATASRPPRGVAARHRLTRGPSSVGRRRCRERQRPDRRTAGHGRAAASARHDGAEGLQLDDRSLVEQARPPTPSCTRPNLRWRELAREMVECPWKQQGQRRGHPNGARSTFAKVSTRSNRRNVIWTRW